MSARIGLLLLFCISCFACRQTGSGQRTAAAQQTVYRTLTPPDTTLHVAYLAGGCFWCTEASFERIRGVQAVVSGYAGGPEVNPTYEQVSSGQTGHTESIAIYYDTNTVDYPTLLDVFFVAHDPTTLNRQGPDVGAQYRSAIFYTNDEERSQIEQTIRALEQSGQLKGRQIVTQVVPFEHFYPAEEYHQGYYELHPENPYVQRVSKPKVEKVEQTFPQLLKPAYKPD